MGWFDSTNAVLGIRGMEQQKKNDRWSKLMDIASLLQSTAGMGADLWKTVSGRKHDFALASTTQGYGVENREDQQIHDIALENLRLENDKGFIDFKNKNPGKSMEQLTAEYYMTPEGKAFQEDQETRRRAGEVFDHSLRMKEILANQGGGLSKDGWKTYDNAIARAISTYYEQDEMRNYVLRQGVTQDTIREFLNGFLDPAFTSSGDVQGLKRAFDLWLKNPDFPGDSGTGYGVATDTPTEPPGRADLITTAKNLIGKLAGVSLPPAEQDVVDDAANMLSRPPSAGGGVYDVQGLLSKLQTIYNTWQYRGRGNTTGQLRDDLRVVK